VTPFERPPLLPRAAIRFGFLGLAPLAISALVTFSSHADTAHLAGLSFSIYAAALLSFLGGVRCGFELMRDSYAPNPWRLFFSALPALAGWALALFVVVVPGVLGAASIFAGLFAAQAVWDYRSTDAGAPAWYPLLRQVLTGGAMIVCILIPLAAALRRI
jgi:hypothetical protein